MIKSFLSVAFATALMGLVAHGQQQSNAVSSGTGNSVSTPQVTVFPVRYSSNSRYLEDQSGTPFPIMGRTAWFLTSLSVADYRTFVDDTAARGYNAIEFHVVNHDPRGNHPPFNGNNDRPFLNRLNGTTWNGSLNYGNINNEAPDFSTPNEPFWTLVDGLLAYCETKGILVFMFPAYLGFLGGNQGWMQELVANGPTRMQTYGAWIATRYRNQKNLVWMMGGDMGDFNTAQNNVENALLTGLKSVTGQQSTLFSAEWGSNQELATDQTTFGSQMTLNGVYRHSGDVNGAGRRGYSYSPTRPAFLVEGPYDQEASDGNGWNPDATQPVRRFQWWSWLSTIGGYIVGNGYVWPFNAPDWQNHLDTQCSRDMTRLNAFMGSIAWYKLVPSGLAGMRNLITAGGGSTPNATNYVTAAAAPDGTLMVAYIPPAHTGSITVDMGAMSGPSQARWFDPTSAAYIGIGTGLANTGTRVFTRPGNNSVGQNDWVLLIETGAGAPTPTPTATATATAPPTATPTAPPSPTPTSTPIAPPTPTATATATAQPTATPTAPPSPTSTPIAPPTPTATATAQPTATPTAPPSPTPTPITPPTPTATSAPSATPATGLVAAYNLNEGSGTTVTDFSGNGITGTIQGAAWTTAGKYGNALSFNGSTSYVDLGNPALLQMTGSMTWSAWVKAADNPSDDGQIVSKSDSASGWQSKTSPDTGPHTFGVAVSGGVNARAQRYSTTVRSLDVWYYVAGVYDAAAATLDIYVNGELDNDELIGTIPTSQLNSAVNVNIGRRTGGLYFSGVIDEVRIYNRALSQTEIQADMISPMVTPIPTATPIPTSTPINISGSISYCSNPGPVPNVSLTLTGSASGLTLSDGSGNYQLSSLVAGGSYTVTPIMTALTPGSAGIDTVDVIATQQHFLNIEPLLPGCGQDAAEVSGNERIDTSDVVGIQRFYLGLATGIGNAGKYKFTPASRAYTGITNSEIAQDYDALVYGDVVSGFVYRPESPPQPAAADKGTSAAEIPATVAAIALPEVAVDALVTDAIVPVTTTAVDAKNKLVGFQGDFTFDERVVTFRSEPVQKGGITGGNWNVSGNVLPGPGPIRTLRISAFSNDLTPLSGSGTLFELRMNRMGNVAQSSPLIWTAPPDNFIFIDAALRTQKPGIAVPGTVTRSGRK